MTIKLHTPAWHAAKAKTIGGSEVAALYGLSPYESYFGLYHKKAGNISPEMKDNPVMSFGRVWESAVMDMARVQGLVSNDIIKRDELIFHPNVNGMSCSLDYQDGDVIIEIKTVNYAAFKKWQNEEPPANYLLQGQHQLACTGAKKIRFLVWVIGEYEIRHFDYEREDSIIASIEENVTQFWKAIENGDEPNPDFKTDCHYISELFATVHNDYKVVDGDEAADVNIVAERHQALGEKIKDLEAEREACKARMLYILGDYKTVSTQDYTVTAGVVKSSRLAGLKELQKSANGDAKILAFIDTNTNESSHRGINIKKVG